LLIWKNKVFCRRTRAGSKHVVRAKKPSDLLIDFNFENEFKDKKPKWQKIKWI